jgi:hypothetical protein
MDYIIVTCPHCNDYIEILKKHFNCKIFRHGMFKNNGEQIPPHLEKTKCDELLANNEIYGCGKPFMLTEETGQDGQISYIAVKCDYI